MKAANTNNLFLSPGEFKAEAQRRGVLGNIMKQAAGFDEDSFFRDAAEGMALEDIGYKPEDIVSGRARHHFAQEGLGMAPGWTDEDFHAGIKQWAARRYKAELDFERIFMKELDVAANTDDKAPAAYLYTDPKQRGYQAEAQNAIASLSPNMKMFLSNLGKTVDNEGAVFSGGGGPGDVEIEEDGTRAPTPLEKVMEAWNMLEEHEIQQARELAPIVMQKAYERAESRNPGFWEEFGETVFKNMELGSVTLAQNAEAFTSNFKERNALKDQQMYRQRELFAMLTEYKDQLQGKRDPMAHGEGVQAQSLRSMFAGSMGEMASFFAIGPLMAASKYGEYRNTRLLNDPTANEYGAVLSSFGQAGTYMAAERIQAKYLLPKGLGGKIMKGGFVSRGIKRMGAEVGQEIVQELGPDAIDRVAMHLDSNIDKEGVRERFKQKMDSLVDELPEATIMFAAMSAFSAGADLGMDWKGSKLFAQQSLSESTLRLMGYKLEDAKAISQEPDALRRYEMMQKAQEGGRVETNPVVPEAVMLQAQQDAYKAMEAEIGEEGVTPVMTQNDDGTVTIKFPDGTSKTVANADQAFAANQNWAREQTANAKQRFGEATEDMAKFMAHEQARLRRQQPGMTQETFKAKDLLTQVKEKLMTRKVAENRVRDFAYQEAAEQGLDPEQHAVDVINAFNAGETKFFIEGEASADAKIEAGVLQAAIRISDRANVATVWEEAVESHFHGMLNSGRLDLETAIGWVQEVEQSTGKKFLSGTERSNVIEALSAIGKAYALDEFTKTLPSKLQQTLEALLKVLNDLISLAAEITNLRESGGLNADLEANLRAGLGFDGGALYKSNISYHQKSNGAATSVPSQADSMAVSAEVAADVAHAKGISENTKERFFGQIWPQILKDTAFDKGTFFTHTGPGLIRAAHQAMDDMVKFQEANPEFLGYYTADWNATRKALESFIGGPITDSEMSAFRWMIGAYSPSTPLKDNCWEAFRVWTYWMAGGDIREVMTLKPSEKDNWMTDVNELGLSSPTVTNKIRSTLAVLDLMDKTGMSWGDVHNWMGEMTTPAEMKKLRTELGYGGNPLSGPGFATLLLPANMVPGVRPGMGQDAVMKAVQKYGRSKDLRIPWGFFFGKKVGPYTLNSMGYTQFNTIDIWESRLIRTYLGLFDARNERYDLPTTIDEDVLMMRFVTNFNNEFRRRYPDTEVSTSDLQAIRWFYMIDTLNRAGFKESNVKNISGYTQDNVAAYANEPIRAAGLGVADPTIQVGERQGASLSIQPEAQRVGTEFQAFFSDVTKGTFGTSSVPFTPELDMTESKEVVVEWEKHKGNFDEHIMKSIPTYYEHTVAKIKAILGVFGKRAKLLDIAASEGSFGKTITALGGPQTVSLDPNEDMAAFFQEQSQVEGATYAKEAFQNGFTWDGQTYPKHDPGDGTYDVVHESMGFQFIDPGRDSQYAEVKRLMKSNGVFLTSQKVFDTEEVMKANEKLKDVEHKDRFFTKEDLAKKEERVGFKPKAPSEANVIGMKDNMVTAEANEATLLKHWKHVVQFWDSGNFRGYAASDSKSKLDALVRNMPNLNSRFATRQVPAKVTHSIAKEAPVSVTNDGRTVVKGLNASQLAIFVPDTATIEDTFQPAKAGTKGADRKIYRQYPEVFTPRTILQGEGAEVPAGTTAYIVESHPSQWYPAADPLNLSDRAAAKAKEMGFQNDHVAISEIRLGMIRDAGYLGIREGKAAMIVNPVPVNGVIRPRIRGNGAVATTYSIQGVTHGTRRLFKEFDPSRAGERFADRTYHSRRGIHFTGEERYEQMYRMENADEGGVQRTIVADLDYDNPLTWDQFLEDLIRDVEVSYYGGSAKFDTPIEIRQFIEDRLLQSPYALKAALTEELKQTYGEKINTYDRFNELIWSLVDEFGYDAIEFDNDLIVVEYTHQINVTDDIVIDNSGFLEGKGSTSVAGPMIDPDSYPETMSLNKAKEAGWKSRMTVDGFVEVSKMFSGFLDPETALVEAYLDDRTQTVQVGLIMASSKGGHRGQDMLQELKDVFPDWHINVYGCVPDAWGFYRKMEQRGVIDSWQPDYFETRTEVLNTMSIEPNYKAPVGKGGGRVVNDLKDDEIVHFLASEHLTVDHIKAQKPSGRGVEKKTYDNYGPKIYAIRAYAGRNGYHVETHLGINADRGYRMTIHDSWWYDVENDPLGLYDIVEAENKASGELSPMDWTGLNELFFRKIAQAGFVGYKTEFGAILLRDVPVEGLPYERGTQRPKGAKSPSGKRDLRPHGSQILYDNPSMSIKKAKAPKKTKKAYKLFRTMKSRPGEIFPLFMGKDKPTPIGEWIEAEIETGKIGGRPLAQRPGWHSGDRPSAPHLQKKDGTYGDRVWAEVLVPDDVDWQAKADKKGRFAKNGNWVAGEIRGETPKGGHYRFKTNPNMEGEWLISGAIKVTKLLTEKEVAKLVKEIPPSKPLGPPASRIIAKGNKRNPAARGKGQQIKEGDTLSIRAFHGTTDMRFKVFKPFSMGTHFGTETAAADRLLMNRGVENEFNLPGRVIEAEIDVAEDEWLEMPDLAMVADNDGEVLEDWQQRVMETTREWEAPDDVLLTLVEMGVIGYPADYDAATDDATKYAILQGELEAQGYHGITYKNGVEDFGSTSYLVWNPKRIKIADEVTMGLQREHDAMVETIGNRAKGSHPGKVEAYSKMLRKISALESKLNTLRMYGQEDTGDTSFDTLRDLAFYDAVLTALPPEVRSKLGGYVKLASLPTEASRIKFLQEKLPMVEKHLDTFLAKASQDKIKKLIKDNRVKMKDGRPQGKGADFHEEMDAIESVLAMDASEVTEAMTKVEDALSLAEDDDVINQLAEEWVRLSTFGNALAKGKLRRSAEDLLQAADTLAEFARTKKNLFRMIQESERVRREKLRDMMIDEVSGGRGMLDPDAAETKEMRRERDEAWRGAKGTLSKVHLRNQSWEWLLNAAARNSRSGTLKSKLHKWAARLVHNATHEERRRNMAKQEHLARNLAAIFDIETKGAWRFRLSKALDEFTKEKATGIYRQGLTPTQKKITVPLEKAQKIAEGAIEPEALGLTKQDRKMFQDLLADEEAKPAHKRKKSFVVEHRNVENAKEQVLSQDQAVQLWLMWQQEGNRAAMEYWGYDASIMEDIRKFMGDRGAAVAAYLNGQYAQGYHELNPTFKEQFGVNMPRIKNYAPAHWHHMDGKEQQQLTMDDGATAGAASVPGFAKSRIKHRARPRQDIGALTAYSRHFRQANHFIAWAAPMRDLNTVFRHRDGAMAIEQYGGRELKNLLHNKLEQFGDGGNRTKPLEELDWLRRQFTIAALTYNWGVMLKQLTSLPAFLYDMPVAAFAKYEARALADWKGLREIWSNEFVQERFKGGFDRDVMMVLEQAGRLKGRSRIEWLINQGMMAGRLGDIAPVIFGGYAIYHHTYDQAIKAGNTPEVAKAEAQIAMEMSVERAQQAGDTKDMSYYQSAGSAARLFTMFTTSMRQYYSNTYDALLDWKAGHPGAGKDFAKRVIISHVLLPVAFQFMTDVVRNVRNLTDDDEETGLLDLNPLDYVRAMLIGPLNGLFVFGHGITGATGWGLNAAIDFINSQKGEDEEAIDKVKVWGYSSPPVEWVSDLGKSLGGVGEGVTGLLEDPSLDDIGEIIDGLGQSMKVFGGRWMAYDVAHRLWRSTGLNDETFDLIRPGDEKAIERIKADKKKIYALDAEELKTAKGGRKKAIERNRYNTLAAKIIEHLKPLSNEEALGVLEELKEKVPDTVIKKVRLQLDNPQPNP